MEAILNILDSYDAQDQCQLDVVHFGVGDVSENDVYMAETFAGKRSAAGRWARTQPDGFVVILQSNTCRFPTLRLLLLLLLLSGSIYGFNVGVSRSVQQAAAKRGIPLRLHSIIYKLMDELKEELSAKLPPLISKTVIGETHSA